MNFNKELELFKNNTVVNWHEHVWIDSAYKLNIESCDLLAAHLRLVYTDKAAISFPLAWSATPETVETCNNVVAEAVARHPDLYLGMCFVDPHHGKYAVAEIERCINELGFIGVKLYHQCKMDDSLQYSIIEKCIELDIPILMHAGRLSPLENNTQPNLADSRQFYNISQKYPEAVIIMAHIGGGGDWHWQLKGLADCRNIFVDISGSVYDFGIVEETVEIFGAERVLFGTDGSLSSGVGKLLGAELTDQEKITILSGPRFAKYINRRKN